MADLVIADPDLVLFVSGSVLTYNAGVALAAGKGVVLDASNLWQLADATAERNNYGITLNPAAIGQSVSVIVQGTLDLGISLSQGLLYCISATSGGIAPITDLVATNFTNVFGYADDDNQLILKRYGVPYALV
jgi:tricorn protease-like protein